ARIFDRGPEPAVPDLCARVHVRYPEVGIAAERELPVGGRDGRLAGSWVAGFWVAGWRRLARGRVPGLLAGLRPGLEVFGLQFGLIGDDQHVEPNVRLRGPDADAVRDGVQVDHGHEQPDVPAERVREDPLHDAVEAEIDRVAAVRVGAEPSPEGPLAGAVLRKRDRRVLLADGGRADVGRGDEDRSTGARFVFRQ